MMSPGTKSILCALAAFCTSSCVTAPQGRDAQPQEPVLTAEKPRDDGTAHFVLVQPDAYLYTAPTKDAQRINSFWSIEVASKYRGRGRYHVLRFLAEDDEWVAVETLAESPYEDHCHGSMHRLEPLRLRLFVHKDDLAPVIVRPVVQTFKDGTVARLTPGVGVYSLESERGHLHRVWVDGLVFSIYLNPEDVGTVYPKPQLFEKGKFEKGKSFLSRQALKEGQVIFGRTGQIGLTSEFGPLYVVDDVVEQKDGSKLASFSTDCASFRAKVPATAVDKSAGVIGALAGTNTGEPEEVHARKGATVYWPDGTEAGTTVAPVEFHDEIASVRGRRCFRKALRFIRKDEKEPPAAHNFLQMCFEPKDVVDVADPEKSGEK